MAADCDDSGQDQQQESPEPEEAEADPGCGPCGTLGQPGGGHIRL